MKTYIQAIEGYLQKRYEHTSLHFTKPPSIALGDVSLPCFPLARVLKKSPEMIANDLKKELVRFDFIEKIDVKGGYLNIFFNREQVVESTLQNILSQKNNYGSNMAGKGKTALIEHTSINPNASPHIGRARNALIGDVLVRLMRFEGYTVDTHYFVNDVGKQIAMLVYAIRKQGKVSFKALLQLYVEINEELKEHPEIEEEVFQLLYAYEQGDEEVRTAFAHVVDICINGQVALFNDLGITYDTFQYESDYIFNHTLQEIIEKLRETGQLEEDEKGRLVLNQEVYNLPIKSPYLVLSRKDKTSLYPLRDIAYTMDKARADKDINVIVLGEDQKLYHQQVSAALDLLGYEAPKSVHYSFVLLTDGKMATREGRVVLLEDFMDKAVEKAKTYMQVSHREVNHEEAKKIAYGAVKFAMLRVANNKNVVFDLDKALSFEGSTGPYLQYSIARINSILKKCDFDATDPIDYSLLSDDESYHILLEMEAFHEIVEKTLTEASPNILANYIYHLTKKFSSYYHKYSILYAESEQLKQARLALIQGVKQVISNGLYLLGIDCVEQM